MIYNLTLFTSNRCNLNCIYCSTEGGEAWQGELTLNERLDVIKQAKDLGARYVIIPGRGEPLLDKDIFNLIEYIYRSGMKTVIATNGTLITKDIAKVLFKKNVSLIVKINSFNSVIHDELIGKKDIIKWVEYTYGTNGEARKINIPYGLRCLLDIGYNKRKMSISGIPSIMIEMVITKLNYKCILEIARFGKYNKIPLFIDRLIIAGRALKNYSQLEPEQEKYKWLYKELCKILGIEFILEQKSTKCHIELNPVIDANGDALLCCSRNCHIGNIRDKSLKELFEKVKEIRKMQSLRWYDGILNKYFKTCAGRRYNEHIQHIKKSWILD